MKTITVRSASSGDVGGCNNCNRYVTAEGGTEHRVWVIEVAHGPEIRLCDDCLTELADALAASGHEGIPVRGGDDG